MSGTVNLGMPLFISGPSLTPLGSGINLYLFGTLSNSGMQGGIPLFLEAISGDYVASPMNLFLKVDNFAPISGSMNLYLNSENAKANNYVDLFIANNPTSSGLSLYMKGLGNVGDGNLADGYYPYQSGLNLYIERNFGNDCKLFVRGLDVNSSGNIDLFLKGVLDSASGLALSIPNTVDDWNNNLSLIIQGF